MKRNYTVTPRVLKKNIGVVRKIFKNPDPKASNWPPIKSALGRESES